MDTMNDLPPDFAAALQSAGRRVDVSAGRVLVDEGDASTDVFLVHRGRLRVSRISESGREPHLAELSAGHIFGELAAIDGQPRSALVTAVEPSALSVVSGTRFRELLKADPAAMWWLLEQLSLRSRLLTRRTFELATMSVSQRIALEVARLAEAESDDGERATIRRFPTHETLAARAGTHREAVTRALGEMKRAGLIQQSGRTLEVASIAALRDGAGG